MSWLLLFLFVAVVSPQQRKTSYNENEARMLLKMSAGAYGVGNELTSCVHEALLSTENEVVLDTYKENCDALNNPCESYIVASPDNRMLYVVFRGTKTDSQLFLEGWSTIQPGQDFFGMGQVNRYFFKGHRLLWPELNATLRDPRFETFSVTFTGHSLGGALAALAAARTAHFGLRTNAQIRLVTFGEPRVGTAAFAFNFDQIVSNSFRVVFRMDIVPHLPACQKDTSIPNLTSKDSRPCDPACTDKAYHHGTEIWYPSSMEQGGQYVECTGLPKNEDFGCSDQFKFSLKNRSDYIWDHRHYFSVRVPEWGKAGCNPGLPEGAEPADNTTSNY